MSVCVWGGEGDGGLGSVLGVLGLLLGFRIFLILLCFGGGGGKSGYFFLCVCGGVGG